MHQTLNPDAPEYFGFDDFLIFVGRMHCRANSENNDDLDLTNLERVTAGPLHFPFTCKEVRKGISAKLKNNK